MKLNISQSLYYTFAPYTCYIIMTFLNPINLSIHRLYIYTLCMCVSWVPPGTSKEHVYCAFCER